MKKYAIIFACLFTLGTVAHADNDKPISITQLPETARQFIKTHFAKDKVAVVLEENELFGKTYEVVFSNQNKVEFQKNGNWKEVSCRNSEVPGVIVPKTILDYVKSNHADLKIVKIERDSREYDVHLTGGLELKFDMKFNLIGYDD